MTPPNQSNQPPGKQHALTKLIDAYCAVWNESDPVQRKRLLSQLWATNATYTDPSVHAATADELLAHIAEVQARRPGAKVVRTSAVDEHHGLARFTWHVVQADASTLREGLDIAEISPDGTIQRIAGFFGTLSQP
jgi:SnoaL-like domain